MGNQEEITENWQIELKVLGIKFLRFWKKIADKRECHNFTETTNKNFLAVFRQPYVGNSRRNLKKSPRKPEWRF